MAVSQEVILYNKTYTVPPVINAVQNDTDRQVVAKLGDFTLASGMTAKLSFHRPDDTHYETTGTVSVANNTVTAELDQALTQVGVVKAQIKVTESSGLGSTFTFVIKVQEDVAGEVTPQEGGTIIDALETAQDALETAQDAVEKAEELQQYIDSFSDLQDVLDHKANLEGVYPGISAGGVFDESSYQTDNAPYLLRASGGDVVAGRQEKDELIGGTVAWNQKLQNGNFAANTNWQTTGSSSVSIANNELTITPSAKNGGAMQRYVSLDASHKMFVGLTMKSASARGAIAVGFSDNVHYTTLKELSLSTSYQRFGRIIEIPSNHSGEGRFIIRDQNESSVGYVALNAKDVIVTDLTSAFGSTIADYVYSLETTTVGSGIAWLRKHGFFTKDYYPYNAGELMSVSASWHRFVGKNLFDIKKWLTDCGVSSYTESNGYVIFTPNNNCYSTFFELPQGTKTISLEIGSATTATNPRVRVKYANGTIGSPDTRLLTGDVVGIALNWSTVGVFAVKIQTEFGSSATTYEPYHTWSYPLDPDLTLRGIPKLNGSKLYYDGDRYAGDGTVTRRYGVVDLGSLTWARGLQTSIYLFSATISDMVTTYSYSTSESNIKIIGMPYAYKGSSAGWSGMADGTYGFAGNSLRIRDDSFTTAADFKTAMSGVMLVYELATPTTESADPYDNYQSVDRYGTEEYIDERTVPIPVGHETRYYTDYLSALKAPSTDGVYSLKVTVANGVPTYSWVSG